jgi:hypothetical protein
MFSHRHIPALASIKIEMSGEMRNPELRFDRHPLGMCEIL